MVSLLLSIIFIRVLVIMPRNIGQDPWDARSLEWATHTPVPEYNFAIVPHVNRSEAFWDAKKKGHNLFTGKVEKIHMPNNSGVPFIMSVFFFVWGFSLVFSCGFPLQLLRLIGIFACMALPFIRKRPWSLSFQLKKLKKLKKNCEVLNNENRLLAST